ncbi:MAG: hypothetical protein AAFX86_01980 [Pseudomonadota bacterium]
MSFGYFAPAPAAMPVGLPVFGKAKTAPSKPAAQAPQNAEAPKKAA